MKPNLPSSFIFSVVIYSMLFGVAFDLVTAHMAVEYFTIHHPKVVESQSPLVMAFVWGIGASWWFGLICAITLWQYNARRPNPMQFYSILALVRRALVIIWIVMMSILLGIYCVFALVPAYQRKVSFEHDRRLMSVAITHQTEYVLGGIALIVVLWKISKKSSRAAE